MKLTHGESDHERIERLVQTFKTVTFKECKVENSLVQFKSYDCTECGNIFSTSEEQKSHYQYCNDNSVVSKEDDTDIVCELCDKVLPNKRQKSNHMLFQHTVTADRLKCDYCGYVCSELMKLCKHISSKHSELFPSKNKTDIKCDMCYIEYDTKEEVIYHMKEKHSPDSFYEKIVEDISGEC